ncbi:PREDICTED: uncharacterized protein LOC106750338 [Dinoponera quadriceps]|uniref:Uncharacterized protein LOC106750338 n=1 Tax=Dinoponera quadriceps TaxID=609295 RepID=A0A6P3Y5B7_DINQU|nr:PREDICTED: uncharacterized protein LOC106750338 [Dinoponera quadriceps]XP_014486119.1 PREDICTED: uncharacterized protein LOC106750338 [Dinoponera quadriceps]XP_014486120.1 PREDICTED: uncharacterized protein LOC106750338 [Dinoponera quadriceps]XP_014486121.1 PREDICTED: uncharacterized protein LOC106750338 [Dinoponera quadriceps]XP_014486122.1 PREDICTED: uncharacterized protein LOC106750338 [Dinoponera quadriceps]XP_014486124.1 PREDICTED: uncharacterized protein LOC106750338 [Dinoponera quadr
MSVVAAERFFVAAAKPVVAKKREAERAATMAAAGRYAVTEMRHSRSEDLLGCAIPGTRSPSPSAAGHLPATASEDDLIASSALRDVDGGDGDSGGAVAAGRSSRPIILSPPRTTGGLLADRIDPEDSIRDIVTENDLYRFVLFKRHYDKYVALSAKYEEAKDIAYYLEERYHEVKAERDKLEEARRLLDKRLEGCEAELRTKEDELFLQLEKNLRLEEEVERIKYERDSCLEARKRLDQEQQSALRRLHMQLDQNEITRRSLERARLDVVRQANIIREEKDALERENKSLREKLRIEQNERGAELRRREEGVAALTRETVTLRHAARHLRAVTLHATSCRSRRRCSICLYARRTFAEVDDCRDDGNIFKCLQAPLQDLRSWFRPCSTLAGSSQGLRTNSLVTDQGIGYVDDSSVDSSGSSSSSSSSNSSNSNSSSTSSSTNSVSDDEACPRTPVAEHSVSLTTSTAPPTVRAFSSDSGFSSEIGDRRSQYFENVSSSTSSGSDKSRKISDSLDCNEGDERIAGGSGFSRGTKWTSSLRRLLGRKSKSKSDCSSRTSKTDKPR